MAEFLFFCLVFQIPAFEIGVVSACAMIVFHCRFLWNIDSTQNDLAAIGRCCSEAALFAGQIAVDWCGQPKPAGNRQNLTGGISRLITGKVDHSGGNLLGQAHSV